MQSLNSIVLAPRKRLLAYAALTLSCALAMPQSASASDDDIVTCSARSLRGVYQFAASGYQIVNGAAVPKAIIETLAFDGYGNVSAPAVSISFNGIILQPPQGSPGIYSVDADCTGTLTFGDAIMFDLQIAPSGKSVNMLQTNPNTVMQGTAVKVLPLNAWAG